MHLASAMTEDAQIPLTKLLVVTPAGSKQFMCYMDVKVNSCWTR